MYSEILREKCITSFGTTRLPEGFSPFPELCFAISFMAPISRAVMRQVAEVGPTKLYFHNYKVTNTFLDNIALQITLDIRNAGCDAAYVPASQSDSADGLSAILSHKAVARLCGLGGIGQNALFLSSEHGPAVRLSTVLTDMPLPGGAKEVNPCMGCGACVRACPCGALWGRGFEPGIPRDELIDAKKCSIYMKKHYMDITRGDACGQCVAACPKCY